MCNLFGGGGSTEYDARKSGDFGQWETAFNKKADVENRLAKGEITQQQADAELAQIGDLTSLADKIKQDPSGSMDLREVKRQHDIDLGKIGIDKAFSQFDDGYYDKYKTDYNAYYKPQLAEQFGKAMDKTTASLVDRGIMDSTVGGATIADLTKKNAEANTQIANEATDAANKLRGSVESAKSNLYNLNEASADPQTVNAQAVGSATALVAPPAFSPLANVFADVFNSLNNFQSAYQNRPTANYKSPYTAPSGYGSGRVVK